MTKVIFTHDDAVGKWEATVEGAVNDVEARQAFTAVVLSCQLLDSLLLKRTIVERIDFDDVDETYKITPVVR